MLSKFRNDSHANRLPESIRLTASQTATLKIHCEGRGTTLKIIQIIKLGNKGSSFVFSECNPFELDRIGQQTQFCDFWRRLLINKKIVNGHDIKCVDILLDSIPDSKGKKPWKEILFEQFRSNYLTFFKDAMDQLISPGPGLHNVEALAGVQAWI